MLALGLTALALLQPPHPDIYRSSSWMDREFWLYPVERNPHRRLPYVDRSVFAVHRVPGTTFVWAVGGGGLILHSKDDGKTWERQYVTSSELRDTPAPTPPPASPPAKPSGEGDEPKAAKKNSQSTAPAPGGAVIKRASWTQPHVNPRPTRPTPGETEIAFAVSTDRPFVERLMTVFMLDANNGWAATRSGLVVATSDGRTWRVVGDCNQSLTIGTRVFFLDAKHGFISSWDDVRFTADGGTSWDRVPGAFAVGPCPDGSVAVIGNAEFDLNQDMYEFLEAGFSAKVFPVPSASVLSGAFVEGDRGIVIVAGSYDVVATVDGGKSWHKSSISGGNRAGGFISGNSFLVVVESSEGIFLLVSTDGVQWTERDLSGKTLSYSMPGTTAAGLGVSLLADVTRTAEWGELERLNGDHLSPVFRGGLDSLAPLTDTVFIGSLPNGRVLHSHDSGRTWRAVRIGQDELIVRLGAIDTFRAWAMTARGTMFVTQDQGQSWIASIMPPGFRIDRAAFANVRAGLAFGHPMNSAVKALRSADAGQTWTLVEGSNPTSLLDSTSNLFATSDGEFWMVGPEELYRTRDLATTWERVSLEFKNGDSQRLFQTTAFADSIAAFRSSDGILNLFMNPPLLARALPSTEELMDARHLTWNAAPGAPSSDIAAREQLSRFLALSPNYAFARDRHGTLLRSRDLGRSWQALPESGYSRTVAPWYYVAMAGLGCLIAWSFVPVSSPAAKKTIGEVGVSDDPIDSAARDKLGFAPLARGIAYFLVNPKTEAPLTIAITGAWGCGKSSLMRLLRSELRDAQFPTAWFNAWHQQSELSLLATLLEGVQKHAAPSMLDPHGWLFRARLLGIRTRQKFSERPIITSALALIVVAAIGWALVDTPPAAPPAEPVLIAKTSPHGTFSIELPAFKVSGTVSPTAPPPEDQSPLIDFSDIGGSFARVADKLRQYAPQTAGVIALVGTLLGPVRRGLVSFGVDPGKLVAVASPDATAAELRAQTSFRERFAKEFEQVTTALGHKRKFVLFIDDLDRCAPDKVVEMLEAANYLVTAGRCVIVMGFAPDYVRTSITLQYATLIEGLESRKGSATVNGEVSAKRQRDFATHYLEKLVNIEVPVPDPERDVAAGLVLPDSPATRPSGFLLLDALPGVLRVVASCSIAVFLLCLAFWLGHQLLPNLLPRDARIVSADSPKSRPIAPSSVPASTGASAVNANPLDNQSPHSRSSPAVFGEPDHRSALPLTWVGALGLAFSAAALGGYAALRQSRAEDTEEFRVALRAWFPLIDAGNPTPREIKRYLNRVRYYAMRQRANEPAPPWWKMIFRGWDDAADAQPAPSRGRVIDEDALVALSAIEQFRPEYLTELATTSDAEAFFNTHLLPIVSDQAVAAREEANNASPAPASNDVPNILAGDRQQAQWTAWLRGTSVKDDARRFQELARGVTVR